MRHHRSIAAASLGLALTACFDPPDRRPGTHLSGELAALPPDWTFTAAHQEIASTYVVEGFQDNIMPKNFGELITAPELDDLVAYLLAQQ